MDREQFFRRLDDLQIWSKGGRRAPHKPLLLLLALGRVARGEARLARYDDEIESQTKHLLRRFGPPRRAFRAEQPFWRLRKDDLWEIPEQVSVPEDRRGNPSVPALRQHGVRGGFPQSLQRLLQSDPELLEAAAVRLLEDHFPASLHQSIRDQVGLPAFLAQEDSVWQTSRRRKRDPEFRERVLGAYERRCVICDFDARIAEDPFGLEAAHIRWHSHGGPDQVPNGLALCTLHHRALDRGAIGLESAPGAGFLLLVSQELTGRSEGVRQLVDSGGRPLRPPPDRELLPDPGFVAWHREQVFRGEPRGA